MRASIILEGPDGAGKTTLARAIHERFGDPAQALTSYRHLTYVAEPRVSLRQMLDSLQWAEERWQAGQLSLIDRHWVSECLYDQVYRRGLSPVSRFAYVMDALFARQRGVYVLCLPRDVESARRAHARNREERPEMYDSIDEVAQLYLDLWRNEHTADVSFRRYGHIRNRAGLLLLGGGVCSRHNWLRYCFEDPDFSADRFLDELGETVRLTARAEPCPKPHPASPLQARFELPHQLHAGAEVRE